MGDNFFNWPYSQFKYYESNYLLERLFPLPDYLIDADTSVKSRVEVGIHGRILDVKYTQILMKLSQVVLLEIRCKNTGNSLWQHPNGSRPKNC